MLWHGSLRELTNFAIRIFVTCVNTVCLPVGFLVFGLLDLSVISERSVDSSSELALIQPSALPCGSNTGCSTTTLCVSRMILQRGLL